MGRSKVTLRAPQLHFVCGKGGVGKSTYACALAQYFVQAKQRTLLVQVNAKDSHSGMLKVAPIGHEMRLLQPLLWVTNLDPKECLYEYLMLKVHSKHLYNLIFDNPLMRSFLHFVPSLAELNMLGKIWWHAEEKEQGVYKYERIVVDCPSTGHGLRFLKVAQVTHDGIQHGGIAQEAQQMSDTLRDPKRSGLHVVTLAEEMPVNETLELVKSVENAQVISLYRLVVNRLTNPIFDKKARTILKQLEQLDCTPRLRAILHAGVFRSDEETQEQSQVVRLESALQQIPLLRLAKQTAQSENAIVEAVLSHLQTLGDGEAP